MASALKANGGTHAWRRLRARWEWYLATVGPWPCQWCGMPVTAADRWFLGHPKGAARLETGEHGDDEGCAPAHQWCDQSAGARMRDRVHREHDPGGGLRPSRDW